MTEFTKEDIEYYRKQYALWTSRGTTPEELHLISRLRDTFDEIERLQQRIEELEKERQWIPVGGGKLPKEKEYVLLCKGDDMFVGNFAYYKGKVEWRDLDMDLVYPTHWQERPQPPREVKE